MKYFIVILSIFINFVYSQDCPSTGSVTIANPGDCSSFIVCINGRPNVINCAPGTFFDPEFTRCDNVACNPCLGNRPTDITFYASIMDCAEYHICIGATTHKTFRCDDHMYFNSAINSCDLRGNVNCKLDNIPRTTPKPTITITDTSCPTRDNTSVSLLPHPQDCNSYFICSFGRSFVQSCARDLTFDVVNRKCDVATNSACLLDYTPGCTSFEVQFFPHPFICEYFFICAGGQPLLQQCAPDLAYDYIGEHCIDKNSARCYSNRLNYDVDV